MRKYYTLLLLSIVFFAAILRFTLAPNQHLEAREDVILFQLWGYSEHVHGLTQAYTAPVNHPLFIQVPYPNYLPPYLYVLYFNDWLRTVLQPGSDIGTTLASVIAKTTPILFELGTILLLAAIVRRRAGERWALVTAAVYTVLPPMIFTTAGWGQVDAMNTFFMVLCVWMLEQRRYIPASIAFTLAFFIKMQSLVLLPLLLYELVRYSNWKVMLRAAGSALGVAVLLTIPFLMHGRAMQVLNVMIDAPGSYPHPSANAFNLWWLFSGGHWLARSDLTPFLGVPLVKIGAILFFAAVAFALWFRHRTEHRDVLWLTAAFLTFSFFMLPTQMHERYLFPFFALLLPAIAACRPARLLAGALALTYTWNLLVAFIIITHDRGFYNTPDKLLGHFWGGSFIVALLQVALYVGMGVWFWKMMHQRRTI